MARILEFEKVSKRFGGLLATNDVSFHVDEGEIVFLIGPNGAGKTTVFNLITGYVKPDAGTIRFAGQDITGGEPYQATRLGIGRTFQVVQPLPALTVRENVMLGTFLQHPRRRTRRPARTRCWSSWGCAPGRISWPAGFPSPSASCWRWRGPSAPGRSSSSWTR